jgi:hydroxyacylglutathione hydrolase
MVAKVAPGGYSSAMPKLRLVLVQVTPFQQNCSILFDEATRRAAVIDPGGDLDRITQAIAKADVKVEKILLTHGHIDHAGGAAELKEKLGVPIVGPHRGDAYLLKELATRGLAFGITDARNFEPDTWLDHGDEIEAAGFDFKVIHAPGHSPGSVVLFNAENKFAFMGDVLFKGSVGRTDLPGGSHETLINSIRHNVLPLGDDVNFLPGHGQPSSIGDERHTNPYLTGQA